MSHQARLLRSVVGSIKAVSSAGVSSPHRTRRLILQGHQCTGYTCHSPTIKSPVISLARFCTTAAPDAKTRNDNPSTASAAAAGKSSATNTEGVEAQAQAKGVNTASTGNSTTTAKEGSFQNGTETAEKSNGAEAQSKKAKESSNIDDDSEAESETEDDKEKDPATLLRIKEVQLKDMDRTIAEVKQKALSNLAEIENTRGRTRRDADSIKQYALENFAKSLLDVADNLGRAASTVPESVRNESLANDDSNHAKLLKSLLEGVDMTEKQLIKIFNKFGVQKFDPVGEHFDPKQHLAIVEVEDATKEPQTIASVVKSGYMLQGKIIRPAEVNVVKKAQNQTQSQGS